jgi:hypothetical protein
VVNPFGPTLKLLFKVLNAMNAKAQKLIFITLGLVTLLHSLWMLSEATPNLP